MLAAAGLQPHRPDRRGDRAARRPTLFCPPPARGHWRSSAPRPTRTSTALLAELDDPYTRAAVTAERSLLAALEAGCSAPVGALADLLADGQVVTEMRLRGVVGTTDGATLVQLSTTGPVPASHDEADRRSVANSPPRCSPRVRPV